jgi:hypothetical protein
MNEQQLSGLERVRQMTNPGMAPLVCDKCGSEWFYEVGLRKYAASAYSSAAGGDLTVISSTDQAIRVCICGRPVPPTISGGRRGIGPDEMRSAAAAVENTRDQADKTDESIDAIVRESVTARQLEGALKEIDRLSALLAVVEELIISAQKPKQMKKTAKEKPGGQSKK